MEDHFNQNHPESLQTLFALPVKLHFEGHENELVDVLPIYESTSDTIFMVNDLQGTNKTMANVATYIQRAVACVMAQNGGDRSLKPENVMNAILGMGTPALLQAAPNERLAVLDKMSLLLGFLPLNAQESVIGHLQPRGITAEDDGRLVIAAGQAQQLPAPAADNDDEGDDEGDDEVEDAEFVMQDQRPGNGN